MTTVPPNIQSVERTGDSHFAQFESERQRRLSPVAHAGARRHDALLFHSISSGRSWPDQSKTTDEILSHYTGTNGFTVLTVLLSRIGQKADARGETSLTETEHRLVAAYLLEAAVNNGGFARYFFNSTGNDAEAALTELKEMGGCTRMARQIRIEYAGATYHVMARWNHGQAIYGDDQDRKLWLEALGHVCCLRDRETRRFAPIRGPPTASGCAAALGGSGKQFCFEVPLWYNQLCLVT